MLAVALSKEMPFLSMTPHLWNTMALHPSFLTHCCLHAATFPAFVRMSLPMARPHAPKSSPPSMLKFFFSVHPTPAVRRLAACDARAAAAKTATKRIIRAMVCVRVCCSVFAGRAKGAMESE